MAKSKLTPKATRQRPRRGGITRKVWEPSARDMEMFHTYNAGGVTYRELEKAYKVSRSRVATTFRKINEWLFPQFAEDIRGIKVQQTESLMHIFREAMVAWERSKLNAVSETVKDIEFGEGGEAKIPAIERSTTTKGQAGDPRFLAEARAALAEIREVWGANAPIQIEHSGELRVAGMSVEEANQQLLDQIERVKGKMLLPSAN